MILTKEEARSKTCVHDRDYYCTSTQCMAWRWHDSQYGFCGLAYAAQPKINEGQLDRTAQKTEKPT